MTSSASGHRSPITTECPASCPSWIISLMALNRLLDSDDAPQTVGELGIMFGNVDDRGQDRRPTALCPVARRCFLKIALRSPSREPLSGGATSPSVIREQASITSAERLGQCR
jgi:hypothetical protein